MTRPATLAATLAERARVAARLAELNDRLAALGYRRVGVTPRRTDRKRQAVLALLADGGTMNARAVARRTGASHHAAEQMLCKLAAAGLVVRVAWGWYALRDAGERNAA